MKIRSVMILLWLLSAGSVMASVPNETSEKPFLVFETTGNQEQVIEAIRTSVRAHGLELLREETRRIGERTLHTVFFCDFAILSAALLTDPRSGGSLPCQVTVGVEGDKVVLTSRNPAFIEAARPATTDANCHGTRDLLVSILQDVTR